MARLVCERLGETCEELPACVGDEDCPTHGDSVSVCEKAGTAEARCVRRLPVPFRLTVLETEQCPACSTDAFVRSTVQLFPGADVRRYPLESPEGQALRRKYRIRSLPAYVFSSEFAGTARFGRVVGLLRPRQDGFVVTPRVASVSFWPDRAPRPGRVELFLPSWPVVLEASFLSPWRRSEEPVCIRHLLPASILSATAPRGGIPEEWARRVCIASLYPRKYPEWIFRRAAGQDDERALAAGLELDLARVQDCMGGERPLAEAWRTRALADSLELVDRDISALLGNQLLLRRADADLIHRLKR